MFSEVVGVGIVSKRLLVVQQEARKGGAVEAIGRPEAASQVPDYIYNFTLERPTFSEERFLDIEAARLEFCNPHSRSIREKYGEFFQALEVIREIAGDRLIVVLIPDEFQVNGMLYRKVLETKNQPSHYVGDYPQQRIRSYCAEKGIRMVDLLQPLRSAQQVGRTYHLRDTHWNARGNRVAGEVIAGYILKHCLPEKELRIGPR